MPSLNSRDKSLVLPIARYGWTVAEYIRQFDNLNYLRPVEYVNAARLAELPCRRPVVGED